MSGERMVDALSERAHSEANAVIFNLCCEGLESGRYPDAAEMGAAYQRMVGLLGGAPVHEAVALRVATSGSSLEAIQPVLNRPTLIGLLQR